MSVLQNFIKRAHSYSHESVQIYLSSIWVMYGVFILFLGRGVTTQEIPYSFIFLGHIWHGILLTAIGFIGFWGAIKKNRMFDLVFSSFSTFKSTVLFLELVFTYPIEPEWINFFIRMIASMFLLSRSIYNIAHKY